jgi:hypothetical protein
MRFFLFSNGRYAGCNNAVPFFVAVIVVGDALFRLLRIVVSVKRTQTKRGLYFDSAELQHWYRGRGKETVQRQKPKVKRERALPLPPPIQKSESISNSETALLASTHCSEAQQAAATYSSLMPKRNELSLLHLAIAAVVVVNTANRTALQFIVNQSRLLTSHFHFHFYL